MVRLLLGLLDYDPALRISADAALASEFFAPFRDITDEYTRTPVDTTFEMQEHPVEVWQAMIINEISRLDVVNDGYVDPGDITDLPLPQLSYDPSIFGEFLQGADVILRSNTEQLEAAISEIASDREYLMRMASSPSGAANMAAIHTSIAECDARLATLQSQQQGSP